MSNTVAQNDELPVKSAEEILATATATDLEQRWIDVPEWGTRIRLRELTRAEITWASQQATTRKGVVDVGILNRHLFRMSVQEPRFSEEQYRRLCNRSSKPIAKVMEAISELNGLTDDAKSDGAEVAAAEADFR